MARPERNNVDYFPFLCKEGKAMFYIEQKYGNDGYATWIKLLRQLAVNNYHYINLNDKVELMFLASKCRISEDTLKSIILDLCNLGEFNSELWNENMIVWSDKFVEHIKDAYEKRRNKCIDFNGLLQHLHSLGVRKLSKFTLKGVINPQTKEDYTKEEKSKEEKTKIDDIDYFIELRKTIFNEYDSELKIKLSKYKIDRPICFIGTGIPVMYYDLVEILVICINDIEWQKDIQNRFGLLKYEKSLIDFFLTVKASSEYTKYKGENDFKRHYTNWLNKNTDKYKK